MKAFTHESARVRIRQRRRLSKLWILSGIVICMFLAARVQADEGNKHKKSSKGATEVVKPAPVKAPKANSGEKKKKGDKVLVTGSLIPREVSRSTGVLDAPFHVYVIDSQQIQRSGATSVA